MACGATLKRSLEFDPLHGSPGRSPKRMCLPSMISPTSLSNNTAFKEAAQKFVNDIARRSPTTAGNYHSPSSIQPMNCSVQASMSGTWDSNVAQSDECWDAAGMFHQPTACESPTVSAASSATELSATLPDLRPSSSLTSLAKKDVPLFTLKQVNFLCRKMVADREETIREKYDQVINTKLAEQYESFLKFNHDQQRLRFDNSDAASYVS